MGQHINTAPLGLTESYHVAHRWLAHIDQPPMELDEPADGLVELRTDDFVARIKVERNQVGQGAILALLRSAADNGGKAPILFSPTGFSAGAREFADTRGIALFALTTIGDVEPSTSAAAALMPERELEPAFAPQPDLVQEKPLLYEFLEEDGAGEDEEEEELLAPDPAGEEWRNCPGCGVANHPAVNICASCGTDLQSRLTMLTLQNQAAATPLTPAAGPSTLRCRNCGSHDIELRPQR